MSSAYGQQLNKAGIGGTVHKVYTRQVPFTADLTRDMTRNARIAALTGGGAGRFFSFLFHFFYLFGGRSEGARALPGSVHRIRWWSVATSVTRQTALYYNLRF